MGLRKSRIKSLTSHETHYITLNQSLFLTHTYWSISLGYCEGKEKRMTTMSTTLNSLSKGRDTHVKKL